MGLSLNDLESFDCIIGIVNMQRPKRVKSKFCDSSKRSWMNANYRIRLMMWVLSSLHTV